MDHRCLCEGPKYPVYRQVGALSIERRLDELHGLASAAEGKRVTGILRCIGGIRTPRHGEEAGNHEQGHEQCDEVRSSRAPRKAVKDCCEHERLLTIEN
jgi:hypothetical protein